MSWWNSLETVSEVWQFARFALVICAALTLLAVGLDWRTGKRVDELKEAKRLADEASWQKQIDEAKNAADLTRKELEAATKQHAASEAELRAAAARAEAAASSAQQQVTETDRKLQGRVVTADQRAKILPLLQGVKGGRLAIRATNSTPESEQYAKQIRQAFVDAGWSADPVFLNIVVGVSVPPGLTVGAHGNDSAPGAAVQRAFREAGIDATYEISTSIGADTVVIVVGQKPVK